jgi:hypothetical protein
MSSSIDRRPKGKIFAMGWHNGAGKRSPRATQAWPALRHEEFWLAELPDAKVSMRVSRHGRANPPAEMFQQLGWPPPPPTPLHWGVSIRGELTVQMALADVLRDAGGQIRDDDGLLLSHPIDIAELRKQFAAARWYRWVWGALGVAYAVLFVALMPIWLPLTLAYHAPRISRWLWRDSRSRRKKIDPGEAAVHERFAHYLHRRIGCSGGTIGSAQLTFGFKVICRMPAAYWAARQGMGGWDGPAAIIHDLCHMATGSPWYIQFADEPPEPLADWLDRKMREAESV